MGRQTLDKTAMVGKSNRNFKKKIIFGLLIISLIASVSAVDYYTSRFASGLEGQNLSGSTHTARNYLEPYYIGLNNITGSTYKAHVGFFSFYVAPVAAVPSVGGGETSIIGMTQGGVVSYYNIVNKTYNKTLYSLKTIYNNFSLDKINSVRIVPTDYKGEEVEIEQIDVFFSNVKTDINLGLLKNNYTYELKYNILNNNITKINFSLLAKQSMRQVKKDIVIYKDNITVIPATGMAISDKERQRYIIPIILMVFIIGLLLTVFIIKRRKT